MKKLFIVFAFASCTVSKQAPNINLTVTYVHREGNNSELQARRGYQWWAANCKGLPDSVKLGTVITAQPTKRPDTCQCAFKRIK